MHALPRQPERGGGTATTAFATYLRSRGLQAGDAVSLRTALAAARGERHDSDGDGISDVEQLKAGRDPSAGAVDAAPPPEFGCSARVARSLRSSQLAEIIFVGLTMSWAARRRRRWAR